MTVHAMYYTCASRLWVTVQHSDTNFRASRIISYTYNIVTQVYIFDATVIKHIHAKLSALSQNSGQLLVRCALLSAWPRWRDCK